MSGKYSSRSAKSARLSAGVVILRRFDSMWRVLILRAYRNWDFPKGLVEANEDPFEAARREVAEETNLTQLQFRWGPDFRETEPYAQGKIARLYLAQCQQGEVSLPINAQLGRAEHDEFRWVEQETARALMPPRFQPILEWAWIRCDTESP